MSNTDTNAVDKLDRIDPEHRHRRPRRARLGPDLPAGLVDNSGTIHAAPDVERVDDDVVVVRDPEKHGDFRIRTVELTAPTYAAVAGWATRARARWSSSGSRTATAASCSR